MTIAEWCVFGAVMLYLLTIAPFKVIGLPRFDNSKPRDLLHAGIAQPSAVVASLTVTAIADAVSHSRGAIAPELCRNFRPKRKRAQGKPGARCTRSLARNKKSARASSPQVHRNVPA